MPRRSQTFANSELRPASRRPPRGVSTKLRLPKDFRGGVNQHGKFSDLECGNGLLTKTRTPVTHSRLRLSLIAAIATLAGITQATANCCPVPAAPCGCGPVAAPVAVPAIVPEMYVVNQGPVYSGPGSYVTQRNYIEGDQVAAIGYPYVGYVRAPTVPRYYGGYQRVIGPGYVRPRYVRPPLRVLGRVNQGPRVQRVSAAYR